MINRFNRLIKEILQGEVRRTTFQPWEVGFLVDLQSCKLPRSRLHEALRRYQRRVQRQLEHGEIPPIKLSEYLGARARKPAPLPEAPPPPSPCEDAHISG